MWLVNFPKLRVKQYPKGYVVEIQKTKWYGKKYWTHIESVSGIETLPWYYQTQDAAISCAKQHFEWDLKIGTVDFKYDDN